MKEPRTITSTEAVHAGDPPPHAREPYDAVTTPIVQTSTYVFESTDEIVAMTEGTHPRGARDEYGRYGNPTCRAVERAAAALEGTEDSALFASGMAAITTTILALTRAGQHVVFFKDAYRMTREFIIGTLARFGVTHTLVAAGDLDGARAAIRPETRLVIAR